MATKQTSLVKSAVLVTVLCTVPLATAPAWARGGGGFGGHFGGGFGGHFGGGFRGHFGGPRVGVYVGPGYGLWGLGMGYGYANPYYYSPYYYPPTVAVPAAPPVYVERTQAPNYWYYCNAPAGYYPTVKNCPGGWQAVPPSPPNP
jgi:hypothetical protein